MAHQATPPRGRAAGFTLVELLVAITVLGILAGIAAFGSNRMRSEAVNTACLSDLSAVTNAASVYGAVTGDWPAGVDVLRAGDYLRTAPTGTYTFDAANRTVTRSPACTARAVPVQLVEARLSRTGWSVTADSQETSGENGLATNVLDGDTSTFWHTTWSSNPAPLPHTLTVDTGAVRSLTGLAALPRPPATGNGRIGQYRVEVSVAGTAWSTVAAGTWPDTAAEQTASFAAVSARYVRLVALTEAGNRGPWTSLAEFNLLGLVPA